MAEPDAAGMKALFPQFAATADASIEAWLVQAVLRFTPSCFGTQWTMAAYYFAAHHLALMNPDAADASEQHIATGPLTSEKIADLSRSYGASIDMARVDSSLMPYTATRYGQALIGIIQSRSRCRSRVIRTGASRLATSTTGT